MITLVNPTYTARIYDYSQFYRPYVKASAEYYAEMLAPLGVQVEYYPMTPESMSVCVSHGTPKIGIRVCDDSCTGGTAGSTGMHWQQVAPNKWELSSNQYFHAGHHHKKMGMDGRYLTCHENGHSFGNLPHTTDPNTPSCMSALGAYNWDHLNENEWQVISDKLPKPTCPSGFSRKKGGITSYSNDVCGLSRDESDTGR